MSKEKNIGRLPSECTTIIVGDQQSADGSRYLCRSSDFDAMMGINYEFHKPTKFGPREFVAKDSKFRCPLPQEALGYTGLPDFQFPGEWGSAGFNTAGVGMSSTETIFSSNEALKFDPYVEDGLAENCTYNIVLPYIHTAREGVERLGSLIEKYGSAEGFGIGFIDDHEVWYLENACGHLWLATRLPRDQYFVTGNQSRFRDYDPDDTDNYLAAPRLIEFATEHSLYDPKKGKFDFHTAYSHDCKDEDRDDFTYNYPRVWGLQRMFTPSRKSDVGVNDFPVFAHADEPITLQRLRQAFRFHYDGTDHDPYLHNNGREPYRPVSIFRTTQTHIIQVRPELPPEIGHITYVALGMADLGVFLPLYQGVESVPTAYSEGKGEASDSSAYWTFRKVQALGMVNYNAYAPIIKDTYAKLEAENDQRQREFEQEYLMVAKDQPMRAKDMLQRFSDGLHERALSVARSLANELFSLLTADIQKEYLFHGA